MVFYLILSEKSQRRVNEILFVQLTHVDVKFLKAIQLKSITRWKSITAEK